MGQPVKASLRPFCAGARVVGYFSFSLAEVEQLLGVLVRDLRAIRLADRGRAQELGRERDFLKWVVGRKKDVLGANREQRAESSGGAESTPLVVM